MYKRVISNTPIYGLLNKIPVLNKFFVFDIGKLNEINDSKLFNQIISTISNSNGTAKTSYRERFEDLDLILKSMFNKSNISVHDTAVSTGVTSLELYCKLSDLPDLVFNISDKYSVLYKIQDGDLTIFYDANKEVAFGYQGGKLLSEQLSDNFKGSKNGFKAIQKRTFDSSAQKIWLLDPEVMKLVSTGSIKYLDFDLFHSESDEKFDLVRSMNILNTIYFEESMILKALSNIHKSLKDDGYLLLGRTGLDGVNRATIYKKDNSKFEEIKKVNEGSEVDYLIRVFNNKSTS